jgi:hypothetical protein
MLLLSDNDVAKDVEPPPKPVPGTCQWIRGHDLFVSWLEKGTNALLWLTGHPGCGKTMLSYSLAQYFDDACNKSRNVLIYLCQNKNRQTDARAVLIGLILQIIHRHRSLVRYIRSAFEKQGSSIIQSFASLWRIFLRITMDPKSGPLYVILDALDECEKTSCHQLLVSISDMLTDSSQSMKGGSRVKFLITSRPFLHQSYANSQKAFQSQISIDDDQTGYTEDLQTFIQERIQEISLNRQFSNDIRDFLCEAIMSKADRTLHSTSNTQPPTTNQQSSCLTLFARDSASRPPRRVRPSPHPLPFPLTNPSPVTPDSQKSTTQKAGESLSGAGDRVAGAVQPEGQKSAGQKAGDTVRSGGDEGKGVAQQASDAVGNAAQSVSDTLSGNKN